MCGGVSRDGLHALDEVATPHCVARGPCDGAWRGAPEVAGWASPARTLLPILIIMSLFKTPDARPGAGFSDFVSRDSSGPRAWTASRCACFAFGFGGFGPFGSVGVRGRYTGSVGLPGRWALGDRTEFS